MDSLVKAVIVISGKQGSGKTSLSREMARRLQAPGSKVRRHPVVSVKFADPLYAMHEAVLQVCDRLGIAVPNRRKDGRLLQLLGTDWGRKTLGDGVWAKTCLQTAKKLVDGGAIVIIDDLRFRNELAAFPKKIAIRVRLERDRSLRRKMCDNWRADETHPSETDLDNSLKRFDLVLNTTRMTLDEVADCVMAEFVSANR